MKNIRLLFFFIVLCSVTIAHAATGPLHYATFDGSTGYVASGNTSIGNFGTGNSRLKLGSKQHQRLRNVLLGKELRQAAEIFSNSLPAVIPLG